MVMRLWPGRPYPLGATWDGRGVNFALFSEQATKVELCLYDEQEDGFRETQRISLPETTFQVWHGYFPDLRPDAIYGYRVDGLYSPRAGQRFNAHKLLLDPYARSIARDLRWDDSLFGYRVNEGPNTCDHRDSSAFAPLARVIDPAFDWGDDRPLKTPWHETVIYELHVRGFTRLNPKVEERLRGTYAGLATPASIDHLTSLGVTAVELLPIHYHIDDRFLVERQLKNYWGYNTLGFFAPHPGYASTGTAGCVNEFKTMVRRLHAAGIEVILDVVYNHTAEGNERGPTLSMRGIANSAYYRLADDRSGYIDYTGCGNSLNVAHPRCLQLIMDSLRYWVTEMHVDGFRFDLASALGREVQDVDTLAAFFDIIHQDPVLSQVKLIAEPWDIGHGGYQVGQFPIIWTEWNGRYRDCIRRFWKGQGGTVGEFASRLSGSSDLYQDDGRSPVASINFVTCHDGFTLRDLVSFNSKRNDANGENNRDGCNDNNSWNCGAEGPTDDPEVNRLRAKQQRNFLTTLILSQGVPMILAGDEFGQTQHGNNNAYCQDNKLAWLHWNWTAEERSLFRFTCDLVRLRKDNPVFRRRRFFFGRPIRGTEIKDLYWVRPQSGEMEEQDWNEPSIRSLGMGLVGHQISETDVKGEPIIGDSFLLLFNSHHEDVEFQAGRIGERDWGVVVDTESNAFVDRHLTSVRSVRVSARSIQVLRLEPLKAGRREQPDGWKDIVTGGGPGLMQAANERARIADLDAKQASVGIRIALPFEQDVNAFVSQAYEHVTFFTRLHHFVVVSDDFVVIPGGIGTVLETTMIWQLLQVRKLHETPLILVGNMWQGLIEWSRSAMLRPESPLG